MQTTVGKVGLVLSGGGAKGAYQVGVVKGLAELGAQVDVISGASIGALNGAILACSNSLSQGAERLEKVWSILAAESPISVKSPLGKLSYLALLSASGLQASTVLLLAQKSAQFVDITIPVIGDESLLCDKPLQALMDEYIDISALMAGTTLHVSIYETKEVIKNIVSIAAAEIGLKETPDSQFMHVQSLPISEQREVLLASAALPLLYKPREIRGRSYTDGGQGGWRRSQGNTPITPLIEAGCDMVIVTHLSDGSLWSRHDFPETTILEIRPQSSIARDKGLLGGAKDLLGFDSTKIPSWIEQGYLDTMHCLGRVMKAVKSRNNLRSSEQAIKSSEQQNITADTVLSEAMQNIKI